MNIIMNRYHWKWSIGEPYYKSARREQEVRQEVIRQDVIRQDVRQDAINQSLEDDFQTSNKREDLDNKMADRELVLQRGANPFLQQSSYLDDVVVRDMFLKPVNTTQGRVKNGDE
jgi:hypothetical protein